MRVFSTAIASLLLIAGCWTPTPADGAFACNPSGKACPDGYSCVSGTCWRNGHSPDLSLGGDEDLGGTDDMLGSKHALGETCTSADECDSGFCVDGVCCNTACDGQCQACDTQTLGTCAVV